MTRSSAFRHLRRALFGAGVLALSPLALVSDARADEAPTPVATLVTQLPACESIEGCAPIQELLRRGDAVWPDLEVGLTSPDEMTRFWTLGVLHERPIARAREAIAARLEDKQPRIRAAAAMALGKQKDPAVTKWLLPATQDKDVNVRFAAVYALGLVKDPVSVDALLRALRDPDEDVRAHAAQSLGELGDRQAVPALLERLHQDLIAYVRGFSVLALGRFQDPVIAPALTAHLPLERDAKVTAAIADTLGRLGDKASLPALRKLLDHPDAEVVAYAKAAIAALERPPEPAPEPPKP